MKIRCCLKRFVTKACVFTFVLGALCSAKAQDFKGFYVGGYAGGNNGTSDAHTFTQFSPAGYFASTSVPAIGNIGNMSLSPNGFSGGGTTGFNLQRGSLVLGVEGDFGRLDMNVSNTGTQAYPCCPSTSFTVTQKVETTWFITGRPRIGFVFGRMLVYGTGGLAATRLKYNPLFTDTFATANENTTIHSSQLGWAGGAGVEMQLGNKHWSVKGEYLHADVGQVSTISSNLTTTGSAYPQNPFRHNADLQADLFRGGVNFRF
jgi:outer membrane immunogenic protein